MTGTTGEFRNQLQKYAPGLNMSWQLFAEYAASLAGGNTQQAVAFAGGGQTDATQLLIGFTEITTVVTDGDSVKLPTAAANKLVVLKNDGANYADVFPSTSDTINDGSANAAIRIYPGQTIAFYAVSAVNWETNSQAGGPNVTSIQTGITAFATGGQASATQLIAGFNNVTTCATEGDSVKLLPAIAGVSQTVKNNGATALAVFPSTGDAINGGAADASILILPGMSVTFIAIDATTFQTGVVTGIMIPGVFPTAAAQSLSGAGAVNLTSYLTKFTSTGVADALTIDSGTQLGQRKKIQHVVDGGSGVLTGVFVGGTTITFTDVAEFAELMWTGAAWAVLELGNTAAPGTPPVLA